MIKKKRLSDKSDTSNLVKSSDLKAKLATLATKAELKAKQDKNSESSDIWFKLSRSRSHFENHGTQNYLF